MVGLFTANLIRFVRRVQRRRRHYLKMIPVVPLRAKCRERSGFRRNAGLILFLISGIYLFLPLFLPHNSLHMNNSIYILLRPFFIFYIWTQITIPVLERQMLKFLKMQRRQPAENLRATIVLLPDVCYLLVKSWELSGKAGGFSRVLRFGKILLYNAVQVHTLPAIERA